jgi:hypothetical protein
MPEDVFRMLRSELLAVTVSPAPITQSYGLEVQAFGGTLLELSFQGVGGRIPNSAGDYVALWQNPGSVPWGTAPSNTEQIVNLTPDGDQAFGGLSMAALPYVVAYSVGPDPDGRNIAAVVPLGVGGTQGPLQAITITTAYVGSTSLVVSYTTPAGSNPQAFGHQIVLVHNQGYLPSSYVVQTITPSTNSQDYVAFNGVTMVIGQWYTVAYLAGSQPQNVAAMVSFQVASALPPGELALSIDLS